MAVAVGPPSTETVLRQVAALGASVVRVPAPEPGLDRYASELGEDEHDLARVLVAAIGPWGMPSLVLCGDRSADRGTGALPAFMAHELGAAQALGLVALGPDGPQAGGADQGGRALWAERRLDGGWRERLAVPVPRCARWKRPGSGCAGRRWPASWPPRRWPSPRAGTGRARPTMARPARSGPGRPEPPLRSPDPGAPAPSARTCIRLLALTGALVSHDPPTVIGPVGSAEAAEELIAFLVRHGYLDQPPGPGAAVEAQP